MLVEEVFVFTSTKSLILRPHIIFTSASVIR